LRSGAWVTLARASEAWAGHLQPLEPSRYLSYGAGKFFAPPFQLLTPAIPLVPA
jgi:hypothetical protein